MMNRTVKSSELIPASWWPALKAALVAMVPLWSSKAVGLGAVKSTGLTTFLTLSAVVHVGLYSWLAVPVQAPLSMEAQPITLVSFAPSPMVTAPAAAPVVVPVVEPVAPPVVVPPKPQPVAPPKAAPQTVPVIKTTVVEPPEVVPERPVEQRAEPEPQTEITPVEPAAAPVVPVAASEVIPVADQLQGPSMVATSDAPVAQPVPGMALRGERMASELERYVLLVQQQVQAHLHYPLKARQWHIEGQGRFQFEIAADGSLRNDEVTILVSCGRRMLDRAAIRTICDAAPFSPPPHGALTVTAPIIFELR